MCDYGPRDVAVEQDEATHYVSCPLPACRSHRQRTDAVIFIRRVGFGLLQLVDSFTVYHLFLGILGGMGGPLLEFESFKVLRA